MIEIDHDSCRNLETALSREWLETNGIGGFSSSTIIGLNTRRYHGLLTAATKPPVGRLVLLSKLEETLIIDGRRYELSVNQYSGAVHPQGFQYQTGFRLDPFPVFTYEVEGVRLQKSVFMVRGENTTVVQYDISKAESQVESLRFSLELRPLIAFRDYHSTTHENGALNPRVETENGLTTIKPYGDLPALHLAHDAASIDTNGFWYRNFQYSVEQERGLDFDEDLFSPCTFTFDLNASATISVIASTERRDVSKADAYRKAELERRELLSANSARDEANQLVIALTAAADQFIVARERCKTVIAGYHWFSDWGRDTMIALPGLTLASGHSAIARSIIAEFANHVDRGMLPNRFPDAGEAPEYNTVDATLWFFEAVRSFLQYTNDYEFVRENLYAVLSDIIDWHVKGTRYNIHVDDDGLLYSGEPGVQLTWMDAKVGDWVVTPRHGKPVEIQALWYNALRVTEQLAARFKDAKAQTMYASMANKARASFNSLFWNEEADCLYDVVNGDVRDSSIRPNQILAVSLTNSMVAPKRARSILRVVEHELLTPRGVRTLSPRDSKYIGRYEGDPRSRDGAYHQGTAWPWLMGPYITAYVKTFGEKAGRKFAIEWLSNFQDHLKEACLGQVSEIFDGDAPHTPRGCVAQAWSVAELLRAAVEEVYRSESTAVAASRRP
ncbi:MAG TPA: amylo-alpha-1,6-glucosidase [Pyrinomonadaceae bacterium]|nr:amylo-alpha-1,6-glucosidase [Pyrinomonadaceae bacterium]